MPCVRIATGKWAVGCELEPPAESWGITGGVPASEADLGFKVDV